MGADHRHPIHAVPDKGEKVRDGHHYGHFERPADGVDRHGLLGRPLGAVFGLLGDLILKSGGYKSAKKSLLGYAVFSLWMVGTYIPMYFMVEDSWASFAASFERNMRIR